MQNNPKYLIGYLEENIKPLVLILLKISGCVKTSKGNNNKLRIMSLRIDDQTLLEKH